jgi:Methyltransferase FkbM domain
MKLDIEGHELFALRGAKRALSRGRVRALALEFGISNLNSRTFFKDLWDLLRDDGYLVYRLTPGGTLLPVDHYTEELEVFFRWTTWFAALEAPC